MSTEEPVDFCIFGGGPSGITTALLLQQRFPDKQVMIVERESKLGGCWKTEWANVNGSLLFTEHAPRVISGSNFDWLLTQLDLNPTEEMHQIYGSVAQTTSSFGWDIIKKATVFDLLLFIFHYILFRLALNSDTHQTKYELSVQDWLDNNSFSDSFKKIMTKFSILIADVPYKVTLVDFFLSFSLTSFRQLTDPEKWLKVVKQRLEHESQVEIKYNTQLLKFKSPTSALLTTLNGEQTVEFKTGFLCLSPHIIPRVLNASPKRVKNNWVQLNSNNNYYMSVGFQLHYTQDINLDCYSLTCDTPWDIIIVKTHHTKDPIIKTVLSCALVNQEHPNLPDNLDDLGLVLVNQVTALTLPHKPMYLTFFNGLKFNVCTRQWESKDSGYIRTPKSQLVPYKGKLDNLYLLGSHNKHGVSSIDKVIDNVRDFFKTHLQAE